MGRFIRKFLKGMLTVPRVLNMVASEGKSTKATRFFITKVGLGNWKRGSHFYTGWCGLSHAPIGMQKFAPHCFFYVNWPTQTCCPGGSQACSWRAHSSVPC